MRSSSGFASAFVASIERLDNLAIVVEDRAAPRDRDEIAPNTFTCAVEKLDYTDPSS